MSIAANKIRSRDISKLRSIFNKISDYKIRNDYELLTRDIKKAYSEILGKDLIKLNKEKSRVKKYIEISKTPFISYLMVIVGFTFTFLLKAGFDTLVSVYNGDQLKAFKACLVICIIILIALGFYLVKLDNNLSCYLICLDVLDELENEWDGNDTTKDKNNFLKVSETMNQAIKDADDTIKKAYESLDEVNRNAKFLEYMTVRGTKK